MLSDKLAMLMKSKKEKGMLSPMEKKAKMGVLHGMKDMATQAMRDKLKGLKKVTVASDSEEGLKKGLSMAEKLMRLKEGKSEDEESEDDSEEEVAESPSEESEEMSEEEAMAMYEALKKRFEA